MTREEPSLETLWLQNVGMMDKVQIVDHSNIVSCLLLAHVVNGKLSVWFYFVWQGFVLFLLTESGTPFCGEANVCFKSIKLHHVIWNLWDAVVIGDGKILGAWFFNPVLVTKIWSKYGKTRFYKSLIKILFFVPRIARNFSIPPVSLL
jgi:hypothetical protein